MQYALLINYPPGYTDALSEHEQKAVFADYQALGEDPRARGGAQPGAIEVRPLVER